MSRPTVHVKMNKQYVVAPHSGIKVQFGYSDAPGPEVLGGQAVPCLPRTLGPSTHHLGNALYLVKSLTRQLQQQHLKQHQRGCQVNAC